MKKQLEEFYLEPSLSLAVMARQTNGVRWVMRQFSYQPVHLNTGSADRNGVLVLEDDCLLAILVRLEDTAHGEQRGSWFVEAGIGPLQRPEQPVFASLDEAMVWIRQWHPTS